MNRQQLKRYQAGRCDAHGNRMIAFDRNYLRGYFATFEDLDANPYVAQHEADCPICQLEYELEAERIDRKVDGFIAIRKRRIGEMAFDRGKEAIKNEGGYKGLTDPDCPIILYAPYLPLDE